MTEALSVSVGMWGSAFATSLNEISLKTGGSGLGFLDWYKERVTVTGESRGPCPAATASHLPEPGQRDGG